MTSTPDATRDISSGLTRATTGWRSPEELSIDLNDASQRRFGDYELVEKIGQGGMGVVYRARQHTLDRDVALKLLAAGPTASEGFVERFRSEARSAARMQHPNIVEVYEFGHRDGINFFSMRLIDGETLARRISGSGAMKPREAAMLMRTLAEAIDYAHRLGVLHLDLKPANVLLTRDGTPLVADFGLARRIDAGHEGEYEISGTPSYMSPEQAQPHAGPPGPPADIYGLGAILYECLLARPPFDGGTVSGTLERVITEQVTHPRSINRKIPADLAAICLKCLAKEPAQRYPSARALADDLGRFLENRPVIARKLGVVKRFLRWARREPWKATAFTASLCLALLMAGVVWFLYRALIGIYGALIATAMMSTGGGRSFLAENGFTPTQWKSIEERNSRGEHVQQHLRLVAAQSESSPAIAEGMALLAIDPEPLLRETDRRLSTAGGLANTKDDVLLLLATDEAWTEKRLVEASAALAKAGPDADGVVLLLAYCPRKAPRCDLRSLEPLVQARAPDNAAAWLMLSSRTKDKAEKLRLLERAARAQTWRVPTQMAYERLPAILAATLASGKVENPASGLARPEAVANFVAFNAIQRIWSAPWQPLVVTCMQTVQPVGSELRDTCLTMSRLASTNRDLGSLAIANQVDFSQATSESEREQARRFRREFVWWGESDWSALIVLEPDGPGIFLRDVAKVGEEQAVRNTMERNQLAPSPFATWKPRSPDALRFSLERVQAREKKG